MSQPDPAAARALGGRSPLRELVEKWRRIVEAMRREMEQTECSRERELYTDGKSSGLRFCADDLEAVIGTQPTEENHEDEGARVDRERLSEGQDLTQSDNKPNVHDAERPEPPETVPRSLHDIWYAGYEEATRPEQRWICMHCKKTGASANAIVHATDCNAERIDERGRRYIELPAGVGRYDFKPERIYRDEPTSAVGESGIAAQPHPAFQALEKAVMSYLTFLNADISLGDPEFKMLKARVITLAVNYVKSAAAGGIVPPRSDKE